MIHVNELVVSANVTDNISLLLEQLLPTSELISLVGDDHGFATALVSNLPYLPAGTALKIGRIASSMVWMRALMHLQTRFIH